MTLRPATLFELRAIRQLLTACRLPVADLAEQLGGFVVAGEGDRVIGTGGLERHGPLGLIRSVAVSAPARRRGLGRCIVGQLLADAADAGIGEVWLFTETAMPFFGRLGFDVAPRTAAPPAIRASRQFSDCAAATLMRRSVP